MSNRADLKLGFDALRSAMRLQTCITEMLELVGYGALTMGNAQASSAQMLMDIDRLRIFAVALGKASRGEKS